MTPVAPRDLPEHLSATVDGALGGAANLAVVSTPLQAAIFGLGWLVCGLAAALVLRRRGHDLRSVVGLAVVLGPLFIPLAVELARREAGTHPIQIVPSPDREGPQAIVVLLGDAEDVVPARPVLQSIEGLGNVCLVASVDYESAQRASWDDAKVNAEGRLRRAAELLEEFEPGSVLVAGPPEHGLHDLVSGSQDVIVLTGAGDRIPVDRISASTKLPVLVVPSAADSV